ncbi:MAG: hypothetical protein ACRDYU_12595 [Actinomycetes bacterium]
MDLRLFSQIGAQIRAKWPPNWSESIDLDGLDDLLYEDGIPVIWVPPGEVLDEVLAAPDRSSRINILVKNSDGLLSDCVRVIAEANDPSFDGQRRLAQCAVQAWGDYPEAAQDLAVDVADALIAVRLGDNFAKGYDAKKKKVKRLYATNRGRRLLIRGVKGVFQSRPQASSSRSL